MNIFRVHPTNRARVSSVFGTNMQTELKQLSTLPIHILGLTEDEEAFKGAAPLLFGETFQRRMKEHIARELEMHLVVHGSKIRTGPVFSTGPPPLPRTWRQQLQMKRRGSEIQPIPPKRERQTLPEEGELYQETVTIEFVTVNVFMSFPLIHVMPEMKMLYCCQ